MKQKQVQLVYNTPGGVLSRLQNKLLMVMRLDPQRLNSMIEMYSVRENGGRINKLSQSARTNAKSEFTRREISIKIFYKFLAVLDLKSAKLKVEVTTRKNKVHRAEDEHVYNKPEYAVVIDRKNGEEGTPYTIKDSIQQTHDLAGETLTRLKDKLIIDMGISDAEFRKLIVIYIGKRTTPSGTKSNIRSQLKSPKLTIDLFFSFLSVLDVREAKLEIEVVTKDGKVFTASEEQYYCAEELTIERKPRVRN